MRSSANGEKRPARETATKVILDSSFLFIPTQFHVDIFEELAKLLDRNFTPVILAPTIDELQGLAEEGGPKRRKQAALALQLARRCCRVEVAKADQEPHDDIVVRVASKTGDYVATNDRTLRRRLRGAGVPVIYLRQRSRLALDGPVP
jgi:rRNA-processing protein FCF1